MSAYELCRYFFKNNQSQNLIIVANYTSILSPVFWQSILTIKTGILSNIDIETRNGQQPAFYHGFKEILFRFRNIESNNEFYHI